MLGTFYSSEMHVQICSTVRLHRFTSGTQEGTFRSASIMCESSSLRSSCICIFMNWFKPLLSRLSKYFLISVEC